MANQPVLMLDNLTNASWDNMFVFMVSICLNNLISTIYCNQKRTKKPSTNWKCTVSLCFIHRTQQKIPKHLVPWWPKHQLCGTWCLATIGAGTLLPGHAVNEASMVAEEPEPFTVIWRNWFFFCSQQMVGSDNFIYPWLKNRLVIHMLDEYLV